MSGVKRSIFAFCGLGKGTTEVPALCASVLAGGLERLEGRGLGVIGSSDSELEESIVGVRREGVVGELEDALWEGCLWRVEGGGEIFMTEEAGEPDTLDEEERIYPDVGGYSADARACPSLFLSRREGRFAVLLTFEFPAAMLARVSGGRFFKPSSKL